MIEKNRRTQLLLVNPVVDSLVIICVMIVMLVAIIGIEWLVVESTLLNALFEQTNLAVTTGIELLENIVLLFGKAALFVTGVLFLALTSIHQLLDMFGN